MTEKVEEFFISDDLPNDKRTFTEKIFFNLDEEGQLVPKKIVVVDALSGDPEAFPADRIMLMKNYKGSIERGRRDPIKSKDVIALNTEKGICMVPLDEAEFFAAHLFTIANSIKNRV